MLNTIARGVVVLQAVRSMFVKNAERPLKHVRSFNTCRRSDTSSIHTLSTTPTYFAILFLDI